MRKYSSCPRRRRRILADFNYFTPLIEIEVLNYASDFDYAPRFTTKRYPLDCFPFTNVMDCVLGHDRPYNRQIWG